MGQERNGKLFVYFINFSRSSWVFWATVIISVILFFTGIYPEYSEGNRIGYVTKISNKGMIVKSDEATLVQGLNDSVDFSIGDNDILKQMTLAYNSQNVVAVSYSQWLVAPFRINRTRVITKVTIVK